MIEVLQAVWAARKYWYYSVIAGLVIAIGVDHFRLKIDDADLKVAKSNYSQALDANKTNTATITTLKTSITVLTKQLAAVASAGDVAAKAAKQATAQINEQSHETQSVIDAHAKDPKHEDFLQTDIAVVDPDLAASLRKLDATRPN